MFCWFGENGNIGKQSKFAKSFDGIISDPMEADQEVNLFPEPIREGEAPNQALLDYFAWTNQIRDKYIDHLTDNIEVGGPIPAASTSLFPPLPPAPRCRRPSIPKSSS